MPRQPRTLLWQLGASLMVVQVAVALVFGIFGYWRLKQFAQEQAQTEVGRLCSTFADRHAELIHNGDPNQLRLGVAADAAAADARLTIIAPDGTVLADSAASPAEMDNHGNRPEVRDALAAGQGSSIRYSATVHAWFVYAAQRVPQQGQPLGVVRLARSLADIHAELNRFALRIGAAGATLVFVTFLVLLLISRRVSGHVRQMAESAHEFAQGNRQHRIRAPATRELVVLADSLNEVADQVSRYVNQLELQRNEQQAILQSMTSGVLALDPEHRVLSLNRAAERVLGLSGVKPRRRLMQEIVRQPALNRFVDEAISSETGMVREITLDGAPQRIIEVISELLRDPTGVQVGLLLLLNDVTELRRLESIRTDFVANVSHELRTPITNIKGYVETMMSVGVEDRVQSRQFLEIINRNADRLAAIIDDLLSLARLEHPQARQSLELTSVPARRVISGVVSQYEQAAAAKNIRIVIDAPEDLCGQVALHLAEQALGNLLSNAIKYSPTGTTVTIIAAPAGSGLVDLAVADQGPGIDAAYLSRIFERFYRIDKARSREMGGTGLGLAIVKHIALAHGGRVEVQSKLGTGSVFHLMLPRA